MFTYGLKKRQRGASALGMVFLVLVIGLFVLMAIRLTPKYLEYYSVVRALERVADEVAENPSAEKIRAGLSKYWQVEMISSVSYTDIEITKNSSGYEVTADYRAEVPLFANLSLAADFSKTVTIQ
jgi:hypothetical protein